MEVGRAASPEVFSSENGYENDWAEKWYASCFLEDSFFAAEIPGCKTGDEAASGGRDLCLKEEVGYPYLDHDAPPAVEDCGFGEEKISYHYCEVKGRDEGENGALKWL